MHARPGSQRREVMQEKERVARTLLSRGLTVTQVSRQLACSPYFVRRIAREVRQVAAS